MNTHKILNRTAKALIVAYAIFLSLFALDVFSEQVPWYMLLGGFLIHLVPTYVAIALAVLAWKNAKTGGIALILLGIVFTLWFETYNLERPSGLITFMAISFPLFLAGLLFLLSSKKQNA